MTERRGLELGSMTWARWELLAQIHALSMEDVLLLMFNRNDAAVIGRRDVAGVRPDGTRQVA